MKSAERQRRGSENGTKTSEGFLFLSSTWKKKKNLGPSHSASLAAAARSPLTRSWLAPAGSSDTGSAELYALLEERVSAPSFLGTIERACARARGGRRVLYHLPCASASSSPRRQRLDAAASAREANLSVDVLSPDWWSLPAGVVSVEEEEDDEAEGESCSKEVKVVAVTAPAASSSSTAEKKPPSAPSSPSLLEGSYVVVSRDDVVDAVAHFIALYVASLPQSRDLSPEALRSALATTLGELRRGKVKRLWAWGRWLYRAAALGYGAFGAYTNPWLARAVLAALWTSAKVMVAVAVGG